MVDVCRRTARLIVVRFLFALVAAMIVAPAVAEASTYRWNLNADGNWNVAGNWTLVTGPVGLGYPNLPGDIALFEAAPTTANRTVTIPTGVTISVGSISISDDHQLTIASAGTGLLVFNNGGPIAANVTAGTVAHTVSARVQLSGDLTTIVSLGSVRFTGGIVESGGARSFTKSGSGTVMFDSGVNNTYTGTTTVSEGVLQLQHFGVTEGVRGPLVIGDGTGAASSAEVRLINVNQIANTSSVTVRSDGLLNMNNVGDNIGGLTVNDGLVSLGALNSGRLTTTLLSMNGGTLTSGTAGSEFVLSGGVIANSSSTGVTAVINGGGALNLNGATRNFNVSDGSAAIDLQIDVPIVEGPGAAGLSKTGAGVLLLTANNTYTGDTVIGDGTLFVNGSQPQSAVQVSGADATIGGVGTVGAISVGAGRVAPGLSPGILNSGAIVIGAGFPLAIELNGTTPGSGYDRLNVTGEVYIGLAVLAPTLGFPPPPGSQFTIVNNDGTDPVHSTFAGLDEGTVFTVGGHSFSITYQGGDGNDIVLRNTSPISYFLAEGATGGFFDDDVLIANPNTTDAPVTLTFLMEGGSTVVQHRTVPAQSRLTVQVDTIPGLEATAASVQVTSDNGLPLIVERSMFWDPSHYGGHTANAVVQPELSWVFAEGSQGFFDTYVLVANANASATNVTVTFLREADTPIVRSYAMAPFSRLTVYAGDVPEVVGRSFGMVVEATLPVIAERSMYFASTPGRFWGGGHVNMGITAPSTSWFHAEGATGGFFTTFILLSNPQTTAANVQLQFLLDTGEVITRNKVVGAQERLTINPAGEGDARLENAAVSTVVSSDVPIVSERSMYWPGDATPFGEGHNSVGVVTTALKWGLAEGRVGGPLDYLTYILLANPGASAADVTITYLRESGAPVVKTYTVPPTSRFNVDVRAVVPEIVDQSFGASIQVTNGAPIAVERSLYWNANGVFWAGGTNALATPIP